MKKSEDSCGKKEESLCQKEGACMAVAASKSLKGSCDKKEDPCKKKEDPCKKKEDPCKKKEDPCKKKEDPCKKQCLKLQLSSSLLGTNNLHKLLFGYFAYNFDF